MSKLGIGLGVAALFVVVLGILFFLRKKKASSSMVYSEYPSIPPAPRNSLATTADGQGGTQRAAHWG